MGPLSWVRLVATYVIGLFWTAIVCLQVVRLAITKRGKFFYRRKREYPPPCVEDPTLGTHAFAHLTSVRLHYVASGSEDKPLMLMLHGFPEFWYSWRHQIKAFKKSHRVVAVDLRGYGESDKPAEVTEYVLDKLIEDIAELIKALGYDKCILMGHDWGGAITWGMAAKHPELIQRAIVLNCPHPTAMLRHIRRSWTQFMKSWYMFLVNTPWFPEWFFSTGDIKMLENAFCGSVMGAKPGAFTEDDIEAYKYNFREPALFTGPMNYIRASLRYGMGSVKKVSGIPILLIWGTRDGALSTEMALLSGQYADDFNLKFIDGASHWVQQDEPGTVNQYIREFLKS